MFCDDIMCRRCIALEGRTTVGERGASICSHPKPVIRNDACEGVCNPLRVTVIAGTIETNICIRKLCVCAHGGLGTYASMGYTGMYICVLVHNASTAWVCMCICVCCNKTSPCVLLHQYLRRVTPAREVFLPLTSARSLPALHHYTTSRPHCVLLFSSFVFFRLTVQ